jgi:2-oxoglutarate ferredoxin oxidoreductase subunit alpha
VVPEMNLGQLAHLLRAKYLVDARSLTQVTGLPFKAEQLAQDIVKTAAEASGADTAKENESV